MGKVCCVVALMIVATLGIHAQWPAFRGADGSGVAAASTLPMTWGEAQHVRWRTAIHGRGWSSPVVLGSQIWLTTATGDGRVLSALAVDKHTGRILFDLPLFKVDTPQDAHPFNSYASPTPVIEPGRVYVTFGSAGTAAVDTSSGRVIWERRDLQCNHYRGAGSSPILFGNLLIMHFDGSDLQYLVALDTKTGTTVWRTGRSVDFRDTAPDGKCRRRGISGRVSRRPWWRWSRAGRCW